MRILNPIKLARDLIVSLILAAIIFFLMTLSASAVVHSQAYRQSRIVTMLIQQEPSSIREMLDDRRGAGMFVKFAGALTKAYIDFELIPVNEPAAFIEIFESLPQNVVIEGFEYSRRDLSITGFAETETDYLNFKKALNNREYFALVTGGSYESTKGGVHFEIICASNAAETFLTF